VALNVRWSTPPSFLSPTVSPLSSGFLGLICFSQLEEFCSTSGCPVLHTAFFSLSRQHSFPLLGVLHLLFFSQHSFFLKLVDLLLFFFPSNHPKKPSPLEAFPLFLCLFAGAQYKTSKSFFFLTPPPQPKVTPSVPPPNCTLLMDVSRQLHLPLRGLPFEGLERRPFLWGLLQGRSTTGGYCFPELSSFSRRDSSSVDYPRLKNPISTAIFFCLLNISISLSFLFLR